MSLTVATVAVLGLAGCGSSTTMPNVTGQKLDKALSSVKNAGIDDKVKVDGGGTFGIWDKSNWTVCSQKPAAGKAVTGTPTVSVDRSCETKSSPSASPSPSETASPSATTSASTLAATPTPTPTPTQPALPAVLTAQNTPELAAVLATKDPDADIVAAFSKKYRGKTIEFDGNIANSMHHGSYDTRFDFLINSGDFHKNTATGPNFQYNNINYFDFNFQGKSPNSVGTGTNLHFVAEVGKYNPNSGLFQLTPVSTKVR